MTLVSGDGAHWPRHWESLGKIFFFQKQQNCNSPEKKLLTDSATHSKNSIFILGAYI